MTLKYYALVLRKRWRAVVALVVLGIALAGVITALMQSTYSAQATSFVRISADNTQADSLYQNSQFALNRVESYTNVIHSPKVLGPVITKLGLHTTVKALNAQVSATNPTGTVLLVVHANSTSAIEAEQIANAVSAQLASEIEAVEAGNSGKSSPVSVSLIVPATVPHSPVSPRPALNVALGLLAGLALGIVVAVVREQFDTRVKSTEDLEKLSDASVLGTVRFDPEFRSQPLVALHKRGGGVEDFRTIRTKLQFVNVDASLRQVVISSAVAEEGKTVTACNLALTLAQADLKVCLVEGDLRRPKVTSYLGIDGSLGMTDVLAGLFSVDDVLVPWHRGELVVLPAGTSPPDPAHILGSHAMEELLKQLKERFDLVLIDAPPLLPVSDAAVLGAASDGVILVARHRHVRREQFAAAVQSLRAVGAELMGSVLTHVPAKERAAHYGPDYEYVRQAHPTPGANAVTAETLSRSKAHIGE